MSFRDDITTSISHRSLFVLFKCLLHIHNSTFCPETIKTSNTVGWTSLHDVYYLGAQQLLVLQLLYNEKLFWASLNKFYLFIMTI